MSSKLHWGETFLCFLRKYVGFMQKEVYSKWI